MKIFKLTTLKDYCYQYHQIVAPCGTYQIFKESSIYFISIVLIIDQLYYKLIKILFLRTLFAK